MVSRQATAVPLLVTTALALVGCESTDDGLLGLVPTIDEISAPAGAVTQPATLSARVDPKGWDNYDIYFRHANAAADLETTTAHEKVPVCTPIQGSTALDCHVNLNSLPTGTKFFRWYIDYWLPDGTPGDVATVMRPEPAGQVSLLSMNQGGGGGPITSSPSSGPPPVDVPVIVSPLDGATCVANSVWGDVANVSFEFEPVENARGTGAYQVEIRRADAPTCQVAWTGVGTGFDHYQTCWIADTNTDFHADNLDADTTYRWRVRASDTNANPPVSAPWSPYQNFETAGPGC